MRYIKWSFIAIVILLIFGFAHYTLPQRDIVRIVNTYEERQSLSGWTTMFWADEQSPALNGVENRDVQFIQAVDPSGDPMVYRNEDTGWGWPPYFKFDTASLYTEAADAVSNKDAPQWVIITHYGWRSELLSTFPNAVGVKQVSGPDAKGFAWANAIIISILVIFALLIRLMWRQFKERTIDPLVENVDDTWERTSDNVRDKSRSFKDLFRRK